MRRGFNVHVTRRGRFSDSMKFKSENGKKNIVIKENEALPIHKVIKTLDIILIERQIVSFKDINK